MPRFHMLASNEKARNFFKEGIEHQGQDWFKLLTLTEGDIPTLKDFLENQGLVILDLKFDLKTVIG